MMRSRAYRSTTLSAELCLAALLTGVATVLPISQWLFGSAAHWSVSAPAPTVLALLIGAYMMFLARRAPRRAGTLSVICTWALGSALLFLLQPAALAVYAWHAVWVSLLRTLIYHPRPLALLLDLGLSIGAASLALWLAHQVDSSLFGIWIFFMVQTLWRALPVEVQHRGSTGPDIRAADDPFERARRSAATALARRQRR